MKRLAFWLNVVALVVGFAGAAYTAANYSPEQAIELGVPKFAGDTPEENLRLPLVREFIEQGRAAQHGLRMLAAAFVLQLAALVIDSRAKPTAPAGRA